MHSAGREFSVLPLSDASKGAVEDRVATPPTTLAEWGVSLSPETPADMPALRSLYGDLRAEELALAPWTVAEKAAFLDDQFRLQSEHFRTCHPDADFWILHRAGDGDVVGRLCLDRSGSTWRIVEIGLAADLRGQGLGAALIRWIQDEARRTGARGVDLHVAHINTRARTLYDRLGFTPVDEPLPTHQRMAWFS